MAIKKAEWRGSTETLDSAFFNYSVICNFKILEKGSRKTLVITFGNIFYYICSYYSVIRATFMLIKRFGTCIDYF